MLVGVVLVLLPCGDTHRLPRSIVGHKFLESIRELDVEKGDERHDCEPMSSCVDGAGSVISVHSEHTSDHDTPLQSFISGLESE